jgi:hypothetical protein
MAAIRRELPDDLIAEVLCRLPPRSLAVSRCVCRAWRDLVDSRRLLRADRLPLSVGGIFMSYCAQLPGVLLPPHDGPFHLRRPPVHPWVLRGRGPLQRPLACLGYLSQGGLRRQPCDAAVGAAAPAAAAPKLIP